MKRYHLRFLCLFLAMLLIAGCARQGDPGSTRRAAEEETEEETERRSRRHRDETADTEAPTPHRTSEESSEETPEETEEQPTETEEVSTEPEEPGPGEAGITVVPVPDLPEGFILGMDTSAVLAVENSGAVYYGFDGTETDVFETLAEAGVTMVRLRVWNDPYDAEGRGYGGGNCDADTAAVLGRRATQAGLGVCIDFHYSDFWADPKRQHAPKAWEGMSVGEKAEALSAFTEETLKRLLDEGVDVRMVQAGNETNFGMAGETAPEDFMRLIAAGCDAVHRVAEETGTPILAAVHFTRITDRPGLEEIVRQLEEYGVSYDVFALSYYPFWDGSVAAMRDTLAWVKDRLPAGAEVMLAETSYAWTLEDGDGSGNSFAPGDEVPGYPATVQGQADMVRDVCAAAAEAGAAGVFYWEGTWLPVGPADADNSPLWERYGSGWASSYASDYDPEDAGLYYGGCSWENQALFDFEGRPLASLSVFGLLKTGTPDAPAPAKPSENLVKNPGFEEPDTSVWEVEWYGSSDPTDWQKKTEDAWTGETAFHFWRGDERVAFTLSQRLTGLDPGVYRVSVMAQGGDMGEDSYMALRAMSGLQDIEVPFMVTTWADWQRPEIGRIEVGKDGMLTIAVTVDSIPGSWGTFDDFEVIKIGD